ncbi:MAG: hypothetical protein Q7S21_03850 [archaeon]|nr:hypothetical protein [archaeon]
MNKKSFLSMLALLLAIILVSGCFQPIKSGEAVISYSINKAGDLNATTTLSGIKGADFSAWKIDCKKQIKDTINEVIQSYSSSLSSADATDEDKIGFASAINVLTTIKTKINCTATETDANNAQATYSYTISFAELQELAKVPQQSNALTAAKTNETIEFNIPIIEETIQAFTETDIQIKEIRIKAQGNLEILQPTGFVKQGEEMVLLRDSNASIGLIKLKISPETTSTIPPTQNQNNQNPPAQNDLFSSKIFGFDLIILIAIIFAIIIVVGLIIFFLRKSRESKPFREIRKPVKEFEEQTRVIQPEKEMPSNNSIISRAMEKGLQKAEQKQKEESIEEFVVKTEEVEAKQKPREKTLEEELKIEENTRKTAPKEKEETQPEIRPEDEDTEDYEIMKPKPKEIFTIEEQQDIERLTKALLPKASDFTAEDICEAILNQGFSERIAKEVLRKLGY